MPILTETIIDIADRHTTLAAFGGGRGAEGPFRLSSADTYTRLYRTLADAGTLEVAARDGGVPVVPRLRPAYENDKYWHRLLSSRSESGYPEMAWAGLVPIAADVGLRVDVAPGNVAYRVSPVPRVLIYPFGWSTWLSLFVSEPHSLDDLAGLVSRLFSDRIICGADQPLRLSVSDLFDRVAAAVSRDIFGLAGTRDVDTQDALIVTTVLAKHGGSPALGGMSKGEQVDLLRLVHPIGPPPRSLEKHVYRFASDDPLEYIVFDDRGRFIWLESLLAPEQRNHHHLRCYHNNTFRSLLHAWQLEGFLRLACSAKRPAKDLRQLAAAAADQLETPRYVNASLREYLDRTVLQNLVSQAREVMA